VPSAADVGDVKTAARWIRCRTPAPSAMIRGALGGCDRALRCPMMPDGDAPDVAERLVRAVARRS
jgi:hypothetical protein